MLINLGGLKNPFLSDEACLDYAKLIVETLSEAHKEVFGTSNEESTPKIVGVTSQEIAKKLKPVFPFMHTVSCPFIFIFSFILYYNYLFFIYFFFISGYSCLCTKIDQE